MTRDEIMALDVDGLQLAMALRIFSEDRAEDVRKLYKHLPYWQQSVDQMFKLETELIEPERAIYAGHISRLVGLARVVIAIYDFSLIHASPEIRARAWLLTKSGIRP